MTSGSIFLHLLCFDRKVLPKFVSGNHKNVLNLEDHQMQLKAPFTLLKEPPKKSPIPKVLLAIAALIVVGGGYWFSQSNKSGETMSTTTNSTQSKKVAPGYLDKNDPIFISIKGRAGTDLEQSIKRADPESAENKSLATQAEAWTEEKQNQFLALFEKSIDDYVDQTHLSNGGIFSFGTFMVVFKSFGEMEQKRMGERHDIRVQYLGGDKYVAEFWEDSEAPALASTSKPDDDNIEMVKELIRLSSGRDSTSIEDGITSTQKVALRYTKMMALLYTQANDGSMTFNDPFQPVFDFVK